MAYDENYGIVPDVTMRMIKRYNVSPSDYDTLCVVFDHDVAGMQAHIIQNSQKGYYNPKYPITRWIG